jgi:ABC-2 type transport system ATP-binding protein
MDAPAVASFAVETVGLTKRYPLAWKRKLVLALDHLDLQIRPGEVFGLLGPNGSGKSTTLKLLLGLVSPSEGEARVFGLPPDSLEARQRVGFLPENPYFYAFLNGDETLRFYGKLCGVTGAKLDKRIEELIDLVGLQNGRERPLRSYSKGMLQRIGLAQALIHDPDLLFLDEPTAGVAIFSLGKKVLEGSLDGLLVQNHSTQINLPGELDPAQQERIRQLLAQAGIGTEAVRFSRPQLSLEQLYLRTVQKKPAASSSPS